MLPAEIKVGHVFRYSYLWHWQHREGREHGDKDRPCLVLALVATQEDGTPVVRVLPITHSPPADPDDAIEIPAAVKLRLRLDGERSWIVLTESNRFAWPGPDIRLLETNRPDWALSPNGLGQLRGRGGSTPDALPPEIHATVAEGAGDEKVDQSADDDLNDGLGAEFAAIDALLDRTRNVLDGLAAAPVSRPQQVPTGEKNPLVYDPDWDEEERLSDWRAVLNRTTGQPPVLNAALLWDAWETKEPLQHLPWLGHLLVGAMLRQARKTSAHLVCLNIGLRAVPRERRRARDRTARLIGFLESVTEAAVAGLKEHDRLMGRRLRGRRGHSKLPQLVDLVLGRPLVSSAMIEKDLKVTTRGALNLVAELGLREITGRGRYRAWGIL
jgi:hypothetical protein